MFVLFVQVAKLSRKQVEIVLCQFKTGHDIKVGSGTCARREVSVINAFYLLLNLDLYSKVITHFLAKAN